MRNVIITGVNRGLGAALFDLLHSRGDRILAIGRRFTPAQEASGAALLRADLAVDSIDPEVLRPFADNPVLIHNAAVVEPIGAVGTLDPDAVRRAIAVNLTAPMLLTDALLRVTKTATILFVSSGAAHRPIEGWSAYCATKAGGEMYFNVVAAEHPGVTVVNVNPGVLDTGMQETIRGAEFPDQPRFVERYERGELADPRDVAERIVADHVS